MKGAPGWPRVSRERKERPPEVSRRREHGAPVAQACTYLASVAVMKALLVSEKSMA
jgi:hypothetical protein